MSGAGQPPCDTVVVDVSVDVVDVDRAAVFVRTERGVPLGQDRPVAEREPPGNGQRDVVRAGKQSRAPDEDLERHAVHGRAQVQAGRAGHAVREPPRHHTAVPVAGATGGGKLHVYAERQGHRDRPPGPAVGAGCGHGQRTGRRARPDVRPETGRAGHWHGPVAPVGGRARHHVHGPERAQRHLAGPEVTDRGRGRPGPRRRVHRVRLPVRLLPEVPVQDASVR